MTLQELKDILNNKDPDLFGIEIKRTAQGKLGQFLKDGKNDCSAFEFNGVYIIFDDENKILYIGESYKKSVRERLYLQVKCNKTNSTLAKHYSCCKLKREYETLSEDELKQLKADIQNYNVLAIENVDLETRLITEMNPKWNKAGNHKKQCE